VAFSAEKRGIVTRMSSFASSLAGATVPVKKPLANAEFGTGRQHLRIGIAGPQRLLALHRGDGMDGVRAPNGIGTGLRESEVSDLALRDQLGYRPRDVFDGHVWIDPVLVEEIDDVGAEPLERRVGDPLDLLGPRVGPDILPSMMSHPNLAPITTRSRIGSRASRRRVPR